MAAGGPAARYSSRRSQMAVISAALQSIWQMAVCHGSVALLPASVSGSGSSARASFSACLAVVTASAVGWVGGAPLPSAALWGWMVLASSAAVTSTTRLPGPYCWRSSASRRLFRDRRAAALLWMCSGRLQSVGVWSVTKRQGGPV